MDPQVVFSCAVCEQGRLCHAGEVPLHTWTPGVSQTSSVLSTFSLSSWTCVRVGARLRGLGDDGVAPVSAWSWIAYDGLQNCT